MKKIGSLFYNLMGKFEEIVSMSMLVITISMTTINVFARYLFKYSIPWSQEVCGIAWTWTVMLGVSWCYRRNMHMGVDFIIEKIKPSIRRFVYIFSFTILLVAMVFLTYMSVMITIHGGYKLTSYFGIPYSIKYISAVIAFFNMTIYSIIFLFLAIKKPDEFLQRVALEGNGLDDFDEIIPIEGIPGDETITNNPEDTTEKETE